MEKLKVFFSPGVDFQLPIPMYKLSKERAIPSKIDSVKLMSLELFRSKEYSLSKVFEKFFIF